MLVPSPAPPCRTGREVLPHTAHRRPSPPALRSRGRHGSCEPDQPEPGRGPEQHPAPEPSAALLVLVRDEQHHPLGDEVLDGVEARRRVAMAEVGAPAPKEPVDGADDRLEGSRQQGACRDPRIRSRASCWPLGPQTAVTLSAIITCMTWSPAPTARANSPSLTVSAKSPMATATVSGMTGSVVAAGAVLV